MYENASLHKLLVSVNVGFFSRLCSAGELINYMAMHLEDLEIAKWVKFLLYLHEVLN